MIRIVRFFFFFFVIPDWFLSVSRSCVVCVFVLGSGFSVVSISFERFYQRGGVEFFIMVFG